MKNKTLKDRREEKKICENCGNEEELYELVEAKCCEDCWLEYWQDNEIGLHTSFEDFKLFTLNKKEV